MAGFAPLGAHFLWGRWHPDTAFAWRRGWNTRGSSQVWGADFRKADWGKAMAVCASGKGQTLLPGQPFWGDLCEGRGEGRVLCCVPCWAQSRWGEVAQGPPRFGCCPAVPMSPQKLPRVPRCWGEPQGWADARGGNMSGISAPLPTLPISVAGLGHQHRLREYETCVPALLKPEQAPGHGRGGCGAPGTAGSSGIPGWQHAGRQLRQARC